MFYTLPIAYINIWSLLLGEFLRCRNNVENEHDVHVVAIKKEDSYGQPKLVDHVPLSYYKIIPMFLTPDTPKYVCTGRGDLGED